MKKKKKKLNNNGKDGIGQFWNLCDSNKEFYSLLLLFNEAEGLEDDYSRALKMFQKLCFYEK